jgi:lysophospholipase L1-like esterase
VLHRLRRGEAAALAGVGVLVALTVAVVVAGPKAPPPYSRKVDPESVDRQVSVPVVLVIGDDSVAATDDVPAEEAFPARACTVLHWICNVDGAAGTGYLAGSRAADIGSAPYGGRVSTDHAQYLADTVVVLGGRNDLGLKGDAQGAARQLFHDLSRAYPKARIAVVEPFAVGTPPKDLVRLRSAIQGAARTSGVRWVDSDGWLRRGDLAADGLHLTASGHRAVTGELTDVLKDLTPTSSSN